MIEGTIECEFEPKLQEFAANVSNTVCLWYARLWLRLSVRVVTAYDHR